MARITASVYTSHVPAIGAALDMGKTQEPYWQKVFSGYDFSKQWMQDNRPDAIFLVYNDHATAFSLDFIPTFAIGTAAELSAKEKRVVELSELEQPLIRHAKTQLEAGKGKVLDWEVV
jgi:protocatechuate 4,5-dioxygenase beta chain